jgi:hypothetical protein
LLHKQLNKAATLAVCALGIGLPLFWDVPGHWRLIGALQNSGHTVLFFAMGFCLVWRKMPAPLAFIILLSLGFGIEIFQYFIGKDCDLHDVALDALGIISGIGFFHAVKKSSITWAFISLALASMAFYTPILIAICYLNQWHNYPLLTNFEEPGRSYLIDHHEGSSFELTQLPKPWGSDTSNVLKMGCPATGWPGVALVDLAPDWRGFTALGLDVWLKDATPITLGIALRAIDNQSDHHDVSQHFLLQPGFNHLQWPLADVLARSADGPGLLSKIGKIIVFCMPEPSRLRDSVVFFDNLSLAP